MSLLSVLGHKYVTSLSWNMNETHLVLYSPDLELLLCADNNSQASICCMNQGLNNLDPEAVQRDLFVLKATLHSSVWATIASCQYLLHIHEEDSNLYAITGRPDDLESQPDMIVVSPQNNFH
ncbi:GL25147 [Drosophila persimilis]|uniref:GL25147 n=1 Tax=Drosophila persimilis TaxID=7234 RepID=B4GU63_DROPE|nr:GL25147 [Drosophila persimilis]